MQPISVLLWLGAELATYHFLAGALFNLPARHALLAAFAVLLVSRALLNLGTWRLAARHASPGYPRNVGRRLWLMLQDYAAYLFTFLLVIPLEALWMPADRLDRGGRVVLLVHGYGCSRGVFWLLRRRLEAAGCTVASVSLFPPFISLGRMVPQLGERIEAVCRESGARRLTLVGHSMGGLVCRSYLARHGNDKVQALITLATPNAGSELARYGIGQNAREMCPDSLWLRDMQGEKTGVPTIALCNPADNYVMPQANQRLPGAHNADLPSVGHLAMLYHPAVGDVIVDACTQGRSHS